jgi:Glycosyl transferases group 1
VTGPSTNLDSAASAGTRVTENAAAFEHLVRLVCRRSQSGRFESAVGWARVAAAFATTNPTGALREVRLEHALDHVSRSMLEPVRPAPASHGKRRVLHVLSEGHLIGGHVHMAQRWVDSDDASVPQLVVTRPGCDSPALAEAVRRRGGEAWVFEDRSLLERARRLRAAAGGADVVVCHTHSDDPVPAVAFGGDYAGPPMVMVNHADHVFWLGTGNLSVLMCLREPGAEVSITARGYPASNVLVVPTPLPGVGRQLDRVAAKRRLGIDPAQLVLLTLARAVKYPSAPWHPGFVEVVGPAIRDRPRATLLAVGPDPADETWANLVREVPGRVIVPGIQSDPSPYLDAADVYLDSFPFASITSMLEAATRGMPLLASRRHVGTIRLMSSTGPLDDVVVGAADTASYRQRLGELVDDDALRSRAGARTGRAARRHGSAMWLSGLQGIYDSALAAAPVRARSASEHDPDDLRAYAEALLGIESQAPLLWTIGFSRHGFDTTDRLSALARTTFVRAAQKIRGTGPGPGATAGSLLIPAGGRP